MAARIEAMTREVASRSGGRLEAVPRESLVRYPEIYDREEPYLMVADRPLTKRFIPRSTWRYSASRALRCVPSGTSFSAGWNMATCTRPQIRGRHRRPHLGRRLGPSGVLPVVDRCDRKTARPQDRMAQDDSEIRPETYALNALIRETLARGRRSGGNAADALRSRPSVIDAGVRQSVCGRKRLSVSANARSVRRDRPVRARSPRTESC